MAELREMAELELSRVETHPVAADPADAITRVATEEDADLIVVGSETDARHPAPLERAEGRHGQGGLRRPGRVGNRSGPTR